MEIFLEFLKYGAIGIAMALAVLSYRLLSKEQDRENVREPMLKSIRNYFMMAILLSAFFGGIEVLTKVWSTSDTNLNDSELSERISILYRKKLQPKYGSKKTDEQMDIIEDVVEQGLKDNPDCSLCEKERVALLAKIENAQRGIFVDAVMELQKLVDNDPTHSVNITHMVEQKEMHFSLLAQILNYIYDETLDGSSIEAIQENWKKFKQRYHRKDVEFILGSDISQLLKYSRNT